VEKRFEGIAGLQGREPVGAVLTIGVKEAQKGFPTETDRFHLVCPREENGRRALHPAFMKFNTAPPEMRKVISGNLVHSISQECFEFHLKAQVITNAHPNKKPACTGDGIKALRWMGRSPDDFAEIKCPHERCEFRLTKPPMCKPFMRFLFRLRWENGVNLPTPLVKLTSGSWNSTSNFKGFFDHIAKVAQSLALVDYTLFGFPFMLSLAYQTKPSEKTRFPVMTISPEVDPVAFFMQQRQQIKQLSTPLPVALLDAGEQGADVIYEDVKSISIPAPSNQKESQPDEHGRKNYPAIEIALPENWLRLRSTNRSAGKLWGEFSDGELSDIVRFDDNEKHRKAARCEQIWREQQSQVPSESKDSIALWPEDWPMQRKTSHWDKVKIAELEKRRAGGEQPALFELRYRFDSRSGGETMPTDDQIFKRLQALEAQKD